MSKKIDESFLSNFAKNMAVFVAARAVSSNSDKIKNALGLTSSDSDKQEKQAKQAQDKLEKYFKARLAKLPPDEKKEVEKWNKYIQQRMKH